QVIFFFQAEDGIRAFHVTGVQTCALPILRIYYRQRQLGEADGQEALAQAGLTTAQAEDMHRYLAIANYEDRFVIPTSHREQSEEIRRASCREREQKRGGVDEVERQQSQET